MGVGVISLRPFQRSDIPAVAALEEAYQPLPWTPGVLADELAAENRSYLVAEADVVVGFAGVMIVDEEAHVTNLLVAEERRREGIGRRLFTRLIRDAISMGARHLTLEVRPDNEAARRLYHRFGLVPVGVRPGYYQGEDALIMWAHDIDSEEFVGRLG